MKSVNSFLGDQKLLGISLVRAAYMVLRVTGDARESNRFIKNRIAEGMGEREREICLPVDLARLTAVTWDAICDFPRAAYVSRAEVDDVIHMRRDLEGLLRLLPADLPN